MIERGDSLVAATHNADKLAELRPLLEPLGIVLKSAADLDLAEPEETADSFAGNAVIKADAALAATGLPALADDSGLVVDALGGAPGIYSARWAGPDNNFSEAMGRVLGELANARAADRSARFVAVLALALPGAPTRCFEGTVEGAISAKPRGSGMGYDPIFIPREGDGRTFGEMAAAEKSGGARPLSHRARAVAAFAAALRKERAA